MLASVCCGSDSVRAVGIFCFVRYFDCMDIITKLDNLIKAIPYRRWALRRYVERESVKTVKRFSEYVVLLVFGVSVG